MKQKPLRNFFTPLLIIFLFLLITKNSFAQSTITQATLQKVESRFEKQEKYVYRQTIESVNNRTDGLPSDNDADFIPGKEMLVVAVFSKKPDSAFARMVVTKHFNKKMSYDEHLFQPVAFEPSLEIYYSLLQVIFPVEANKTNCSVNLQVFDKKHPADKVWLLVFSK